MKDLRNSLSMCLYAMQTKHLQKVFCMRGGKKHKSQRLCKAVFKMRCLPGACQVLARCVPRAGAAGWNGCYCGRISSVPFKRA